MLVKFLCLVLMIRYVLGNGINSLAYFHKVLIVLICFISSIVQAVDPYTLSPFHKNPLYCT